MAAVKRASNVGRRERNDKLLPIPGRARLEEAALLPPLVPRRLDSAGIVGLEMGVLERLDNLLLAGRGFVLVGRESRCLSLGRLRGRLCGGLRLLLLLLLLQLGLLSSELGRLVGLGLLLLFYKTEGV